MNESLDKLHSFQKQPEALRLADELRGHVFYGGQRLLNWPRHSPLAMKAEAELRRLHAVEKNSSGGCACRWDAEGDRVATCERHQGWLEVIVEWADRAREAEKKLKALTQREPGEWIEPTPDFYISELSRNTIRFHNAVHGRQEFSKKSLNECTVPVWFTLPPAQRQPLTDEEIKEIARYWSNKGFAESATRFCTDFARAIEAAHGIKTGGAV